MEIDAKSFIQIFKNNFDYEIVNTPLGDGIKMDCFSAFIFSHITGYGYLEDHRLPYTPSDMKLFYNALDYNFVAGLFHNTTLAHTPYYVYLSKPYIFDKDKIIVPVEFKKEVDLHKKLKTFMDEEENHKHYIIARIEASKKGNGMEPFMEYLTCEYFKKMGYIVENQIPISHKSGMPDFGGYKFTYDKNTEYLLNSINIIQLSMLRLGIKIENTNKNDKLDFIVGEAKTSSKDFKQIFKYIKTGFFNNAFEIHPSMARSSHEEFGLLTLDKEYKMTFKPSEKQIDFNPIEQNKYSEWLKIYKKIFLLTNFTNDEFNEYFFEKFNQPLEKTEDIIMFASALSTDEIINRIYKLD